MTKQATIYQPGPVFHDAVLAGLKAIGMTPVKYLKKHNIFPQNLRYYTTGFSNGERSQEIRQALIEDIGPEVFEVLYKRRLQVEQAR